MWLIDRRDPRAHEEVHWVRAYGNRRDMDPVARSSARRKYLTASGNVEVSVSTQLVVAPERTARGLLRLRDHGSDHRNLQRTQELSTVKAPWSSPWIPANLKDRSSEYARASLVSIEMMQRSRRA